MGILTPEPMTPKEVKALCHGLRDAIEERIPDNAPRYLALVILDRCEAHMLLVIKESKRKPKL